MIETDIKVLGIKEALAQLNTFDKRFRRGVTTRYAEIMGPMVNEAEYLVPVRAPMSGWTRAWNPRPGRQTNPGGPDFPPNILPWPSAEIKARKGWRPKPFVSGKRPKTFGGYTRSLAAFGMRWDRRFAALFDATGQSRTPQGAQMVRTLGARYGSPSRAMWRAYDRAYPDVQQEVRELVEDIMKAVGKNIKVVG